MTPRAGLLALLWIVTGVLYLIIVLWSLPMIAGEAGGILPFDLRPRGYSLDEAGAFLNALSDAGRAQYLGPQRWLDIVFPVSLACALIVTFRASFSGWLRQVLIAAAVIGLLADLGENQLVHALLSVRGGDVDAETVSLASLATVVKSAGATVAMSAALFAGIRAMWRRWRSAT